MKKKNTTGTKDRILNHAIREFIEFGFHGARMQRIADRARVNKAMLFYYYSGKEQIYKEVLHSVITSILDRLEAVEGEAATVEDKVRHIVNVYTDAFTRYPEYLKLVCYEFISGGENLREIFARRQLPFSPANGQIYLFLRERMDRGEIREMDALQLILSIVGQVIMPFLARPMFENVARVRDKRFDFNKFMDDRREFIIRLIVNGVKVKRGSKHG